MSIPQQGPYGPDVVLKASVLCYGARRERAARAERARLRKDKRKAGRKRG